MLSEPKILRRQESLYATAFNAAGSAFTAVAATPVVPGVPFTAGVVFNDTTITAYLNGFAATLAKVESLTPSGELLASAKF